MKLISKIILAIAAIVAVGCGGGSGGSGSGGGLGIFLTDDMTTGYDHVWVTVKQVTLSGSSGTKTVFSDANGAALDVKTLRDAQGRRFELLSFDDNGGGTFNSVSVTLDETAILYPTGATTGLSRTFQGASGGNVVLTATFTPTQFGGNNAHLIIDFNLAVWTDDGTNVVFSGPPVQIVTDDNTFNDEGRHEHENYPGTVSNLQGTAPTQTFTLTRGNMTLKVETDANTVIVKEGLGNPVLANGQHVVARGAFNTSTNALHADKIRITPAFDTNEARGTATNINALAGTLDLKLEEAEDFMPAGDPIHVATTDSTVYRTGPGTVVSKDEFFVAITEGTTIEAQGTYDFDTNTLTATKLSISHDHDGGDHGDNAEVTGASSLADFGTHSFSVVATEFSGLNVPPGTIISVATNGDTSFKASNGDAMTEADFYAALGTNLGVIVEVEGHWDGSVLTASKCKLEN